MPPRGDDLRLDGALGAFLDAFAQNHEDEPWRRSLAEAYAEALYEKHRISGEGEAGTWDATTSPAVLAIMSVLFALLYEVTLDPALFHEAVTRARKAAAAAGPATELAAHCLANLAQMAHRRHELSGDEAALAEALEAAPVARRPAGRPPRRPGCVMTTPSCCAATTCGKGTRTSWRRTARCWRRWLTTCRMSLSI